MRPLALGIVLYMIGSAADVYTTKRALIDAPLGLHEANGIMAPVVRRWGWQGIAVVKLLLLGAVLWPTLHYGFPDGAAYGLGVAGVLFLFVAWRNRRLIIKARR